MALELGSLGAARSEGLAIQVGARATVPLSDRVHGLAQLGAWRGSDGVVSARDASLGVAIHAVNLADGFVRLRPGISIPVGGISAGLNFTMLSSASLDPTLGVDLGLGGTWVGVLTLEARVPVYAGWDDVLQGPFGRVDLKGARRLGDHVGFVGVSGVGQARGSDGFGDFLEVAPVAGAVFSLATRWSLNTQVRVPVWTDVTPRPYHVAIGAGITAVLGNVAESHEHAH